MTSGHKPRSILEHWSSRRRFVGGAATLGAAAAAAGLVACSSSKNSNTNANAVKPLVSATAASQGAVPGQSTPPAAAASRTGTPAAAVIDATQGKPGGTLKYYIGGYPGGVTIVDRTSGYQMAALACSALLGFRWGQASVAVDDYTQEPDLAQAMPEQPDPTTYTFKLRPNVKFNNGRAVTSQDVQYSFDRYATWDQSPYKATWQGWYDHVETPDAQTVVLRSKFPYADALSQLGGQKDGFILAKEHEESPDVSTSIVGSGPFTFVSDQAPLQTNFKKNPDYYLKPFPYFDTAEMHYSTDATKRLTDFTTRQIQVTWTYYPTDAKQIIQQRPDAQNTLINNWTGTTTFFRCDQAPFNDKRVRQAFSMSLDRKKIGDLSGGAHFPDQFFPIMLKNLYGTSDVTGLGAAAKYWSYDPQGAKQLMAAAGITQPIETQQSHLDASQAGQFFADQATLSQAQWKDAGIANVKDNAQVPAQYNATTGLGNFEGMGQQPSSSLFTGIGRGQAVKDYLWWGPNGEHSVLNVDHINDPQLNPLLEKQIGQFNAQDRAQTWKQMEAIVAEQQYRVTLDTIEVYWFADPTVKNYRLYVEAVGPRRCVIRWWFDKA